MKKIIILLTFCLLLAGCEQIVAKKSLENETKTEEENNDENKVKKDNLNAFYTLPIDDFGPNKLTNYETMSILRNLNEGLYKINKNGELELGLAKNIDITEVDGYLMYDVTLRDGLKFHNGKTITPEDVQYSIFRYAGLNKDVDPKQFENFKYWINLLDGELGSKFKKGRVETLGSNRIIIFVDDFYGKAITSSLLANTFIVPKNYTEEEQSSYPIGAGPYKFDKIDENGTISLSAFEDYYGEEPEIKTVKLTKSSSKLERNDALLSGKLDIVESYPAMNKDSNFSPISGDIYSLVFNMENESYKSKEFRRAIGSAINKNDIKNQIFVEAGQIVESPLSPNLNKYLGDMELEKSFNPDFSRAYLNENQGIIAMPLSIAYIEEDFLSKAIGDLIVGYMNSLGFNASLNPLSYKDFEKNVIKDKNFEMALYRYSGDIDPHKVLDRFTTRAAKNISGFYSLDYNEVTRSDRENYPKMLEMIKEEVPEIFLLDPGKSYKMTDGLTEPTVYPYPYLDFSSIKNK